MKISICIPYVRPHLIQSLKYKVFGNAGIDPNQIEFLAEEDVDLIGCPLLLKRLVDKATGDYIAFLGDDTNPQYDFLFRAICDMASQLDGFGLVGFNDMTGRTLPTHWVAHKNVLKYLDGEFFHTGYKHNCCDVELMERCVTHNLYYHSKSAVVLHYHPALGHPVKVDEHHKRVKLFNKQDQALLIERRKNGWTTIMETND